MTPRYQRLRWMHDIHDRSMYSYSCGRMSRRARRRLRRAMGREQRREGRALVREQLDDHVVAEGRDA